MKDKKIKVFLLGSYKSNAGPDNVNRCLIENSTHVFLTYRTNRTGDEKNRDFLQDNQ